MVELREPPRGEPGPRRAARDVLVWVQLALLVLIAVLLLVRRSPVGDAQAPQRWREVASKLKAAGALQESSGLLEAYAAQVGDDQERAQIAYGLGQTYLDAGNVPRALRWFYEAEALDRGPLQEELARKIVHSLERLGRFQAAQTALDSRVRLDRGEDVERADGDPIVARIGDQEIYRSEVERALDDLPPELATSFGGERKAEFLRKYVADELMWRKARKLEYDRDPKLQRQFENALQQMTIAAMLEKEVLAELEVDETDLRNYFEANKHRYVEDGDEQATLEQVRAVVQRDYLQLKAQSAYQDLIDGELEASDIELFPERMDGGP